MSSRTCEGGLLWWFIRSGGHFCGFYCFRRLHALNKLVVELAHLNDHPCNDFKGEIKQLAVTVIRNPLR